MNLFKIGGRDIKNIFSKRYLRIAVPAIIITPVLYSLLYLYAFWDPYNQLQDMPVAVVNLDQGSTQDGKNVNYGKDIVENLKNNSEVGWKFVSEEEANKGLDDNEFYAKFEIPKDFSQKVTSAKDSTPSTADLEFVCNEKKNFLAANLNHIVEAQLKETITSSISNNYVSGTFDKLYEVKDGMVKASDGSKQIKDGLSQMSGKMPELEEGITKITTGVPALYDGQVRLNSGLLQLNDGLNQMNSGKPELEDGINRLSTGAPALYDGQIHLNTGILQLNDGLNQLNSKVPDLAKGVKEAKDGSALLSIGADSLNKNYTEGIRPLLNTAISGMSNIASSSADIATLKDGATQLSSTSDAIKAASDKSSKTLTNLIAGLKNLPDSDKAALGLNDTLLDQMQTQLTGYTASVAKYSDSVKAVSVGTTNLISKVEPLGETVKASGKTIPEIEKGVEKFGAGLENLNTKLSDLKDGLSEMNKNVPALTKGISDAYAGSLAMVDGSNQLVAGQNELKNGIVKLSSKSPALIDGITKAYAGSSAMVDGSNKLVSGQEELKTGVDKISAKTPDLIRGVKKLNDGSTELYTELDKGANKLNAGLKNSSKDMGEFVSEPLNFSVSPTNPVPNYGTGFAPYFMALSLWIGALMMSFVIHSRTEEFKEASKFDKVFGKFISFGFIGVLQAILVGAVVLALGLDPTNAVLYFALLIFFSLVFISIAQFFISLFGDAGRLICLILLILQLTACAGTFPLELVPGFFKALNPFMPFTYVVEALKESISATSINYSLVGKDVLILSAIMIVFLTASVILRNFGEKAQEAIDKRKAQAK